MGTEFMVVLLFSAETLAPFEDKLLFFSGALRLYMNVMYSTISQWHLSRNTSCKPTFCNSESLFWTVSFKLAISFSTFCSSSWSIFSYMKNAPFIIETTRATRMLVHTIARKKHFSMYQSETYGKVNISRGDVARLRPCLHAGRVIILME